MLKLTRDGAIIMAMIATLTAATNPDKDTYVKHAVWKLQNTACMQQQSPACYTINYFPRNVSESILKGYVYRQNYIFFSLYETNFLSVKSRSVGVGGCFF